MIRTLGYTETHKITSLVDWHEFMRKLTFHEGKVTRFHEAKIIPSWNALIQHCRRATYVLKLVYSSPRSDCKDLLHHEQYGWQESGSCIEVLWEQHDSPDTASANDDNESTSSEEPGTDSDSDDNDSSEVATTTVALEDNRLSYDSDSDNDL